MSQLFTPLQLGPLKLANRIIVAPMCQYMAEDGHVTDWHTIHLGQMALSGAGLLIIEATAVEAVGRITHGCVGLYSDTHEAALKKVIDSVRKYSVMPIMIQLGHAGVKPQAIAPGRAVNCKPRQTAAGRSLVPLRSRSFQTKLRQKPLNSPT